jgi:hypothetical protein
LLTPQKGERDFLQKLLWVNFLGSSAILLWIAISRSSFDAINPLEKSRSEIFVLLVLVALFSLAVELPGFLLNSRRDDRTLEMIDKFSDSLLDLRLNPSIGTAQLEGLLAAYNDAVNELNIGSSLRKMSESFKRFENVDNSILGTMIIELKETRLRIDGRSKHPLPILVQILGLSGLAFLMAEILAALRGR